MLARIENKAPSWIRLFGTRHKVGGGIFRFIKNKVPQYRIPFPTWSDLWLYGSPILISQSKSAELGWIISSDGIIEYDLQIPPNNLIRSTPMTILSKLIAIRLLTWLKMSLGNAKTDCEIKSYGGVKTPTDLDLTKINQARRLSPHVPYSFSFYYHTLYVESRQI